MSVDVAVRVTVSSSLAELSSFAALSDTVWAVSQFVVVNVNDGNDAVRPVGAVTDTVTDAADDTERGHRMVSSSVTRLQK